MSRNIPSKIGQKASKSTIRTQLAELSTILSYCRASKAIDKHTSGTCINVHTHAEGTRARGMIGDEMSASFQHPSLHELILEIKRVKILVRTNFDGGGGR